MNSSLSIPAAIGTTVVSSTSTKVARLPHKTERRERGQPRKPFSGIGRDVHFSVFGIDEDIAACGPIFNERDETGWLLSGMES